MKTGNYVQLIGKHNTTPPAVSDGAFSELQLDPAGSIRTANAACTLTVVDLETDADVVVTSSPAVLLGLYVNTVFSAHAVLVKDSGGTKLTMAASTAAGTQVDCHSASCAGNITIESDNAATGDLVVFWRAI